MIWEENAYVHVDLRKLLAHLLCVVHHSPTLVATRKASFVPRHPWGEAGDIQVVLLHVGDVLQGLAARHVGVRRERPRRLVNVYVAVNDEDVLELLPTLFLPRYCLRQDIILSSLAATVAERLLAKVFGFKSNPS